VYSNYLGIWHESPDHDNFKAVLDVNSKGAYTLCIRGTVPSKIKDLIIDVQVFKKMHFPIEMNTQKLKPRVSAGLTSMFNELTPKLLLRLESISGPCDLFITGHSQGGAAASLFALWVEHTFPGKFQIKTYIFAPPSIGNKDFSTIVAQYIPYGVYRVVNPLDTIPYFFVNIKALISSNTPRRIPIFFKLVYFTIYLILKIRGIVYAHTGDTVFLNKSVVADAPFSFIPWKQYLSLVLLNHDGTLYSKLLNY
jgi:hypothetical protein